MSGKVKAYCRISTELQLDSMSLENQESRIVAYCFAQGLQLEKIYKDVCSGKDFNRPQFQLMISELRQGDIICIVDLSRLSRSTIDTLAIVQWFLANKIGFVCLSQKIDTSTPEGRMMITLMSSFNQYERENTARKVSSTMLSLSSQGKLRTVPPFGWKNVGHDKDFERDEEQQRVLTQIKEMHLRGMKQKQIADYLNSQGLNKCLLNNKKNPEKFVNPKFYSASIKKILVENGLIEGKKEAKTVEQRIVSHHK
jgi:DNA invertase Pin-like site-specific DNA recombinase